MKKLLIIANLHHASPRIPGLTAYFHEFGWDVTVVTPDLGHNSAVTLGFPERFSKNVKIIIAPYAGDVFQFWRVHLQKCGLRKNESLTEQIKAQLKVKNQHSFVDSLMKIYQTIFAYPDTERTWFSSAFRTASQLILAEQFDLVLSSSPFPTSHRVAAALKKKFKLPWVADFRDTWTQNPVYDYPWLRKLLEERLELKTISGADCLITVSDAYAEVLRHFHKRDVHVIPNGYIEQISQEVPKIDSDKFTITYTGTIYVGKQDPEKFLLALKSLLEAKRLDPSKVEVRFYGRKENWLKTLIEKHHLESVVHQLGAISRTESFQQQRESNVLLFFNWEDSARKGLSHLKLYEYLNARRPIIATGGFPFCETQKILQDTRAGICAFSQADIEVALSQAYQEFLSTGQALYGGHQSQIEKYSYKERAREVLRCVERLV